MLTKKNVYCIIISFLVGFMVALSLIITHIGIMKQEEKEATAFAKKFFDSVLRDDQIYLDSLDKENLERIEKCKTTFAKKYDIYFRDSEIGHYFGVIHFSNGKSYVFEVSKIKGRYSLRSFFEETERYQK
jgi:hypothetical protein